MQSQMVSLMSSLADKLEKCGVPSVVCEIITLHDVLTVHIADGIRKAIVAHLETNFMDNLARVRWILAVIEPLSETIDPDSAAADVLEICLARGLSCFHNNRHEFSKDKTLRAKLLVTSVYSYTWYLRQRLCSIHQGEPVQQLILDHLNLSKKKWVDVADWCG